MRKSRVLLSLLLLGGLVLSGCGDKKDNNSSDSGTPSDTSGGQGGNGGQGGGGSGGGGNQGGEGQGGEGQGGEGQGGEGQGEVPQDSRFVNKKFVVDSITTNPQMAIVEARYANAYVSLFSNGKCELVAPHDAVYDALFGTFTVNQSDNIATISVKKTFDGENEEYSWGVDQELKTLNLEYVSSNDNFTLRILLSYPGVTMDLTLRALPNPPMTIVGDLIPEDPNGDSFDEHYQVNQQYWNTFFKNDQLRRRNFTINATVPGYMPGTYDSYVIEADDYKIHLNYPNYPAAEQYFYLNNYIYESEEVIGINCDVYSKNGNEWVENTAQRLPDSFQDLFGFLPIPFMQTSYSELTHCYSLGTLNYYDDGTGYQAQATNIKVYFEGTGLGSPKIKKITFKDEIQQDWEFNFSAVGTTSVDLPNAGGGGGGGGQGGDPSNPSSYLPSVRNTVFDYNRVSGNYLDDDDKAALGSAYGNSEVAIFNDDSVQFSTSAYYDENDDLVNSSLVLYGTLSFTNAGTESNGRAYVQGSIAQQYVMIGGTTYTANGTTTVRYYPNNDEFRITQHFDGDPYYIYLSLTNESPVVIPHGDPQGGGSEGQGGEGQGGGGEGGGQQGGGGNIPFNDTVTWESVIGDPPGPEITPEQAETVVNGILTYRASTKVKNARVEEYENGSVINRVEFDTDTLAAYSWGADDNEESFTFVESSTGYYYFTDPDLDYMHPEIQDWYCTYSNIDEYDYDWENEATDFNSRFKGLMTGAYGFANAEIDIDTSIDYSGYGTVTYYSSGAGHIRVVADFMGFYTIVTEWKDYKPLLYGSPESFTYYSYNVSVKKPESRENYTLYSAI